MVVFIDLLFKYFVINQVLNLILNRFNFSSFVVFTLVWRIIKWWIKTFWLVWILFDRDLSRMNLVTVIVEIWRLKLIVVLSNDLVHKFVEVASLIECIRMLLLLLLLLKSAPTFVIRIQLVCFFEVDVAVRVVLRRLPMIQNILMAFKGCKIVSIPTIEPLILLFGCCECPLTLILWKGKELWIIGVLWIDLLL